MSSVTVRFTPDAAKTYNYLIPRGYPRLEIGDRVPIRMRGRITRATVEAVHYGGFMDDPSRPKLAAPQFIEYQRNQESEHDMATIDSIATMDTHIDAADVSPRARRSYVERAERRLARAEEELATQRARVERVEQDVAERRVALAEARLEVARVEAERKAALRALRETLPELAPEIDAVESATATLTALTGEQVTEG